MMAPQASLGVIGGMGPLASADFYRKLTLFTPAANDAGHVPLVLMSLPHLPDRSRAILEGSDAPLDMLVGAIASLNQMKVRYIAMPCNTAHHWYGQLSSASAAEIIHIADAAMIELAEYRKSGPVAVLATRGTLESGFFQQRLAASGYQSFLPAGDDAQNHVDAAVAMVKAGAIDPAVEALRRAVRACMDDNVETAILACTELSVLSETLADTGACIIDSNEALAKASLRRLGIEPVPRR